jgi:tripartite-type tricarboxylate transporter receptor subunit TctC
MNPFMHALYVGVAAALLAGPAPLAAQTPYPARTVTLVSPQSPGTAMDVLARLYAEKLAQKLGTPFVVSNRPGAGGIIAAQTVATAAADGYNVLVANSGHPILGALNKKLPFNPTADFTPIAMIGETPSLVVVIPELGVNTLRDFVALAKAKPGEIKYSSAGIGTATHIAGAYFARQAGIQMLHIPYKSGSDGIADMLAGRVETVFAPAAFTLSLLQARKLLALAVSQATDLHDPIEVPSARSAAIDYDYSTWYGFLVSAKTPPAIVATLSQAIAEASEDPELKAKIMAQGISPRFKPPAELSLHIQSEMNRLKPVLDEIAAAMNN